MIPYPWAADLKEVGLPAGLALKHIVFYFTSRGAQNAFLAYLHQQITLYKLRSTQHMDDHFGSIPYVLPPQISASNVELETIEMPDPDSTDGTAWVPAYPLSGDALAALELHELQLQEYCATEADDTLLAGTAIPLSTQTNEHIAGGLEPHQRRFDKVLRELLHFIRTRPHHTALHHPQAVQTQAEILALPWDTPIRRDPDLHVTHWARLQGYSAPEIYSVVHYGLRECLLYQYPTGPLLGLSLGRPLQTAPATAAPAAAFGRGRRPKDGNTTDKPKAKGPRPAKNPNGARPASTSGSDNP